MSHTSSSQAASPQRARTHTPRGGVRLTMLRPPPFIALPATRSELLDNEPYVMSDSLAQLMNLTENSSSDLIQEPQAQSQTQKSPTRIMEILLHHERVDARMRLEFHGLVDSHATVSNISPPPHMASYLHLSEAAQPQEGGEERQPESKREQKRNEEAGRGTRKCKRAKLDSPSM